MVAESIPIKTAKISQLPALIMRHSGRATSGIPQHVIGSRVAAGARPRASVARNAVHRPTRTTNMEAALTCRSCRTHRYSPPVCFFTTIIHGLRIRLGRQSWRNGWWHRHRKSEKSTPTPLDRAASLASRWHDTLPPFIWMFQKAQDHCYCFPSASLFSLALSGVYC
jgi:hypothetical protein